MNLPFFWFLALKVITENNEDRNVWKKIKNGLHGVKVSFAILRVHNNIFTRLTWICYSNVYVTKLNRRVVTVFMGISTIFLYVKQCLSLSLLSAQVKCYNIMHNQY